MKIDGLIMAAVEDGDIIEISPNGAELRMDENIVSLSIDGKVYKWPNGADIVEKVNKAIREYLKEKYWFIECPTYYHICEDEEEWMEGWLKMKTNIVNDYIKEVVSKYHKLFDYGDYIEEAEHYFVRLCNIDENIIVEYNPYEDIVTLVDNYWNTEGFDYDAEEFDFFLFKERFIDAYTRLVQKTMTSFIGENIF